MLYLSRAQTLPLIPKVLKSGEILSSNEILNKIAQTLKEDSYLTINCIRSVLKIAIKQNLIAPVYDNNNRIRAYHILSHDVQKWNDITKEETISNKLSEGINRIGLHEDYTKKILDIISQYSPNPINFIIIHEHFKKLNLSMSEIKLKNLIKNRLKFLVKYNYIKTNNEHNRMVYFIPSLIKNNKSQESQINILKAAFITIGKKLKNGEDVRDVLIKTGELVSEM
jgi:hypothetical protein